MKSVQSYKRTKKVNKQIEVNIKRRTVIVDDQLVFHKGLPIPSWIEMSLMMYVIENVFFVQNLTHQLLQTRIRK